MLLGLKRYQDKGQLHFVTFCCYRREAHLEMTMARDLFEDALERMRQRYDFQVVGYVVMPEHIHLLVSEPVRESLATGLQALKLSVARRSKQIPFWQARYYDFNVFTEEKRAQKIEYMHWNPVKRGLVERRNSGDGRVIDPTAPARKGRYGLNRHGQCIGSRTKFPSLVPLSESI
jgi:putative transposase